MDAPGFSVAPRVSRTTGGQYLQWAVGQALERRLKADDGKLQACIACLLARLPCCSTSLWRLRQVVSWGHIFRRRGDLVGHKGCPAAPFDPAAPLARAVLGSGVPTCAALSLAECPFRVPPHKTRRYRA